MPPGDFVPTWHAERGNLVETFGFYGDADAAPGVVEPRYLSDAPSGSAPAADGQVPTPDPLTDPFPDQVDALSQYALLPPAVAAAALAPLSPTTEAPEQSAFATPVES